MSNSLLGSRCAARRGFLLPALALSLVGWIHSAAAQELDSPPIVHKIRGVTERMEVQPGYIRVLAMASSLPSSVAA